MLGFKSFDAAQDTLAGIELMHMIKKRQLMGEVGQEGLTAAEQFYSLAAKPTTNRDNCPFIAPPEQNLRQSPFVLVVPLTTARAAMRFAGTTLIRPTAEHGLRQASVALVFQLEPLIGAAFRSASGR